MGRRRWLIGAAVAAAAAAAVVLAVRPPWAAPPASPDAAAGAVAPAPGDLYVLTVGVEPKLTAQGKRDPYAGDAWFVRQALARAEPLHGTTHSRVLDGSRATRAAVLNALAWLGRAAAEPDVAVVFFSTHGDVARRGSGAPREGFYLDLAGAGVSANADDCVLWGAELNAALAKVRGRTLLLLDTCRAGAVTQAAGAGAPRVAVLAACAAGEGSDGQRERADRPHGWFVIALCEALAGRADADGNGVVTLAEVGAYVPGRAGQLDPRQNAVLLAPAALRGLPLARVDRDRPVAPLWPPLPRSPESHPR